MIDSPRMVSAGAARLIDEALAAIAAHSSDVRKRLHVRTLKQAADICAVRLVGLQREEKIALWLDEHQRLISIETVAIGARRRVMTNVRDLVRSALEHDARFAIVAHNHPERDETPSSADREFARNLESILAAIGVRLLDSLVVSYDGRCSSIAQAGGLQHMRLSSAQWEIDDARKSNTNGDAKP